ncbi:hypothetical protein CLV24_102350 [Pontibacter ummariensis]|uniref:Lipoprotein n=1 Tax=Pontibacter ummariensis TaxID=1610492 RepID=A0A239BNX0_9BACT|nr:hypothetical protein [Pontibacter ummariensis]PRY15726.1 hypothetical protein CLV24_102350 [Pontibacter ummariensis]SNS09342.1 hypothetical protein SAMN06296052_10262 [Pontibacter ummariensis]
MVLFYRRLWLALAAGVCCTLNSCLLVTEVVPNIADELNPAPALVTYTLKKGGHYADYKPIRILSTARMKFQVTFDSTAIYTTTLKKNQGDINKLYGMSDCRTDHHTNSARFGWRWYKEQLELLAYTYKDKELSYELIGAVPIGEPITCELRMEKQQYVFEANGKRITMPRGCSGEADGLQLYPYFGGNEAAPHDITIKIRELL